MPYPKTHLLLTLLLTLACACDARAEIMRPEDTSGVLTLAVENDLFSGKDNNYTNGIRFSWLGSERRGPDWLERLSNSLGLFPSASHKRWGYEFGQNMYTPEDLTLKPANPDDRPYAGWLYASTNYLVDSGRSLDTLQLTLGVVGPMSLAAETQDFVHHILGGVEPRGWGSQLNNEPGVVMSYEHKWRLMYDLPESGFGVDFIPALGGSAGNIFTHASAGATVRVGQNLAADYGPPLIRPNLPGSDFFVPSRGFGWYLFAGAEGRAVARNIFLDGNTWESSPNVEKFPLIHGFQAGLALTFESMRIAYTQVFRSKEFKGQNEPDKFGAVTVSWRF